MEPSRGEVMSSVLIDACGWVALVDARLNLDVAMASVAGSPRLLVLDSVAKELGQHQIDDKVMGIENTLTNAIVIIIVISTASAVIVIVIGIVIVIVIIITIIIVISGEDFPS